MKKEDVLKRIKEMNIKASVKKEIVRAFKNAFEEAERTKNESIPTPTRAGVQGVLDRLYFDEKKVSEAVYRELCVLVREIPDPFVEKVLNYNPEKLGEEVARLGRKTRIKP